MTDNEKEIAKALSTCTYAVGSYEKRFARSMMGIAEYEPDKKLTEKQSLWLYEQLHRYRRQIPEIHNKYCRECVVAKFAEIRG